MKSLDLQQIVVTYFFLLFSIIFVSIVSQFQSIALIVASLLVFLGLRFQDHLMSYGFIITGLVAVLQNILSLIRDQKIFHVSVTMPIIIDSIVLFLLITIASYFLDAYKKQGWAMLTETAMNGATLFFLMASLGLSSMGLTYPPLFMYALPLLLIVIGCSFGLLLYIGMRKPFVIQFGMREFICSFWLPVVSLLGFDTVEKMVPQGALTWTIVLAAVSISILVAGLVFKKNPCTYGLILSGILPLYNLLFSLSPHNPSLGFTIIFIIFVLLLVASYVVGGIGKHGWHIIKSTLTIFAILLFLSLVIANWFNALLLIRGVLTGETYG